MRDLFAMSDIVISRAGANAICELLALKKPNLLIPLSANASRGDQILNARHIRFMDERRDFTCFGGKDNRYRNEAAFGEDNVWF